ncbi:hypothetical protein [Sporomusa malonica]|uniref:Uncharacterized protein n=1 Tax=Sporomusa malonica TaxID=112901 RepID=A0A1W2EGH5_9FIRM|nr:hypothetical protein [Sporomusa malonica]SMD08777.1 hypothetical protein SAMN04488500_12410 [Sporomusa malonica]
MIDTKIYDRIEFICSKLQNDDTLDEKMIEALYDELEAWLETVVTYQQKAG